MQEALKLYMPYEILQSKYLRQIILLLVALFLFTK